MDSKRRVTGVEAIRGGEMAFMLNLGAFLSIQHLFAAIPANPPTSSCRISGFHCCQLWLRGWKLAKRRRCIVRFKVEKFITTDGYKFLLPGGEWVAFRASGTEPLIRCYIEAKTVKSLKALREACGALLK
jgi:hypothetical protein